MKKLFKTPLPKRMMNQMLQKFFDPKKYNYKQENARRKRQIEKGILKIS